MSRANSAWGFECVSEKRHSDICSCSRWMRRFWNIFRVTERNANEGRELQKQFMTSD